MQFRALRIPYPPPERLGSLQLLERAGKVVDFPERHISYILMTFDHSDAAECVRAVMEAVEPHPHGTEPAQLVLSIPRGNG